MHVATPILEAPPEVIADAVVAAAARIAPLWPLQHFVAVNPFVGLGDLSFTEACQLLLRVTGSAPLPSTEFFREAWQRGEISRADLEASSPGARPADALVRDLEHPDWNEMPRRHTVADVLDAECPRAHWATFVAQEIGKWCGMYFDRNQATWRLPRTAGLYSFWRDAAAHDFNPEAAGISGFRTLVRDLPGDSAGAIVHAVRHCGIGRSSLTDYFHAAWLSVPGWSGYASYLDREDEMRGRRNTLLHDLLAIRLAYDLALWRAFAGRETLRAHWRAARRTIGSETDLATPVTWLRAYERGYQRQLAQALTSHRPAPAPRRPLAQAAFCIDVRSEVFRRHLEAVEPEVQTLGCAGFFGFALEHRDGGSEHGTPRCPALILPALPSETADASEDQEQAAHARATAGAWLAFQNSAASCFSFVETTGLALVPQLARASSRARAPWKQAPRPVLTASCAGDAGRIAAVAAAALRGMSLSRGFARVVLLCGHGSRSVNNPHASALDCGACGGHAGDVNARVAAEAFNRPAVRAHLRRLGLPIPDDTRFVAAVHDTMTDEVVLLDEGTVPETHLPDLRHLKIALTEAGQLARRERAPRLGLGHITREAALLKALRARADDISEVRPEWALANNAAIIVAPRQRTRGLDLGGRTFLHDYDAAADPDARVLSLILSAPVVVASWINLQYYASRVDPARYGAGDKTLHNVVGGIGVAEGNGGDLKVGLPWQSVHDGTQFVHEPRRLTVVVEDARSRIDGVLERENSIRQLVANEWIHLVSIEKDTAWLWTADGWSTIP